MRQVLEYNCAYHKESDSMVTSKVNEENQTDVSKDCDVVILEIRLEQQ
jgi:hypothetical protein